MISDVIIANKSYSIKVGSDKENISLKLCVKLINEKINSLRDTYKLSDSQDLLAMAAIDLLIKKEPIKEKNIGSIKLINQIALKIHQEVSD